LFEQLEQRRNQFAVGEVAAGTKNHQTLRCNDPFLAKSNAERIGDRGDHGAQASVEGLDAEAPMHTAQQNLVWV
jgi:hypothetical protein